MITPKNNIKKYKLLCRLINIKIRTATILKKLSDSKNFSRINQQKFQRKIKYQAQK